MKRFFLFSIFSVFGFFSYLFFFSSNAFAFSDIENHDYKESINFIRDLGVVKGYPDGSFGPDRSLTRAELMKIVLEASDRDFGQNFGCFPDVAMEWFAPYVCYGKANAIIRGYPDGSFQPNRTVTVAEGLKIVLETFFVDIDKTTEGLWFQPYVEYIVDQGIFASYQVFPFDAMTRGQMSYVTHQLLLLRAVEESKEESVEDESEYGDEIMDNDDETDNREEVLEEENMKEENTEEENTEERLVDETENKESIPQNVSALSKGCGQNPPGTPPNSSLIDGTKRSYITAIGKNYDQDKATAFVFAFHGRTNPNTMVRTYYDVEEASDGDAIVIYPLGLPEEGPSRSWKDGGDPSDDLRDFALFDQLLEEFSDQYCIDLNRIYVVGHSLGAWFTNSLACARGDVIRAVGSVGGSTTINECTGPVAAMIMHHPDDRLASFSGGETARDQLLRQNNCSEEKKEVGPVGGNCVEYVCEGDPVVRCPHSDSTNYRGDYYPHTWPDFAGEAIRKFFESLDSDR